MKRELTVSETRTANRLCRILTGLDRSVFPDNPVQVKNVEIYSCAPPKGSGNILYTRNGRKKKEGYVIFGYNIDKFVKTLTTRRHALIWGQRKKNQKIKDMEIINKTNPIKTDEVLAGLAAHEVRHRFQHQKTAELITRRGIHKRPDCYLWVLKEITKYYIKDLIFFKRNKLHYKALEFDASIVQYLFISLMHYGIKTRSAKRATEYLVSVIKIKPSELRKDFLFPGVPLFMPAKK